MFAFHRTASVGHSVCAPIQYTVKAGKRSCNYLPSLWDTPKFVATTFLMRWNQTLRSTTTSGHHHSRNISAPVLTTGIPPPPVAATPFDSFWSSAIWWVYNDLRMRMRMSLLINSFFLVFQLILISKWEWVALIDENENENEFIEFIVF